MLVNELDDIDVQIKAGSSLAKDKDGKVIIYNDSLQKWIPFFACVNGKMIYYDGEDIRDWDIYLDGYIADNITIINELY